jgi:hypothetical protein
MLAKPLRVALPFLLLLLLVVSAGCGARFAAQPRPDDPATPPEQQGQQSHIHDQQQGKDPYDIEEDNTRIFRPYQNGGGTFID